MPGFLPLPIHPFFQGFLSLSSVHLLIKYPFGRALSLALSLYENVSPFSRSAAVLPSPFTFPLFCLFVFAFIHVFIYLASFLADYSAESGFPFP